MRIILITVTENKGTIKMKINRKASMKCFLFTLSILVLTSCGKDIDIFTPDPPRGNINDFFAKVQTEVVGYPINTVATDTIVLSNNSLIISPANAFVDANGEPVEGDVNLELIESYEKSFLMLYDKPTVSEGELLETEAIFSIHATHNGNKVFLSPDSSLEFKINDPEQDPDNAMQIFYGKGEGASFEWELGEPGELWYEITLDDWSWESEGGTKEGFGYTFNVYDLSWISISKYSEIEPNEKTQACVELPEIFNNNNTKVFMSIADTKSVISLSGEAEEMVFCSPAGLIPIDQNVTFIAISDQGDGTYLFGTKDAVIRNNHGEFMVPQPKSLEEILDILSQF